MTAAPADLIAVIESNKREVRKSSGKQIFSEAIKRKIRATADSYFKDIKPAATEAGVKTSAECDEVWQKIRALTHKNAAKTTYLSALDQAKKELIELDGHLALGPTTGSARTLFDSSDNEILSTLQKILPSAAAAYKEALTDLSDNGRHSYRGPATDLRECLRETLDHLAPDEEVTGAPGFKLGKDASGPTMRQKVRYILSNRNKSKAQIAPSEAAVQIVDEIVGTFVRAVYSRSNVSTHTPTKRDEVLRLRHFVRLALMEILEVRT
jgi:hypothetical protein